jgi:hypothetical protein
MKKLVRVKTVKVRWTSCIYLLLTGTTNVSRFSVQMMHTPTTVITVFTSFFTFSLSQLQKHHWWKQAVCKRFSKCFSKKNITRYSWLGHNFTHRSITICTCRRTIAIKQHRSPVQEHWIIIVSVLHKWAWRCIASTHQDLDLSEVHCHLGADVNCTEKAVNLLAQVDNERTPMNETLLYFCKLRVQSGNGDINW